MTRISMFAALASVLTLTLASTANASTTLTNGLQVLYAFENSGDLGENSAIGGSSGTNSGVAHTASGLIGGASDWAANGAILSVAGSDLSKFEFPSGGTGDGGRTIAFWVKTTETARSTFYASGGIAYGSQYGANSAIWQSYSLDYTPSNNNQLEAYMHSAPDGGFNVAYNTTDDASFDLHDDAWHHVAETMVRTGGTTETTLYVDGAILGGADNPDSKSHPGGYPLVHFTLGMNAEGSTNQDLNGLLDEFAIWDRTLTAAEITQIHTNGLLGQGIIPEPSSMLLALWGLVGLAAYRWRRTC